MREVEITSILERMTLEEKIALCSGQNFWMTKDLSEYGVPALFMCDGPHGLRKQEDAADMLGVNKSRPATCFPTAVTTGSSWDEALMEHIGQAIGDEALAAGVGLVLGPGANIKRNPLCGRNFEYISEDPYVSGKMAAGLIRGLQKKGVGASLKHFACNSQELSRFNSDSVIKERTLREIYLTAFEIAVKEARPATVMCAYPKVNGIHCSDSKELLTDILRDEWGFQGLVVTDWGAMNDRIEGLKAGCDLNMPGGSEYMEKDCAKAVRSGALTVNDVDRCAHRVLTLMANAAEALKKRTCFDEDAHHTLAREAAESGAVLLKNEGILPLRKEQKVVLIGDMAKHPRYQGEGSSHIEPLRVVSPLEAMPGCVYVPGCDEKGGTTDALLREAAETAKVADVAVVFAGLPDRYESEGFDRDDMKMPEGHIRMIEAVIEANPNTVVVLLCGSPVECPWADSVKGILYMGLAGQAMGEAVKNLLYGITNPSGKLTESWPYRYEDCISSSFYGAKDAQYKEGIYVGYRYYEKAGVPVRWPFGFGLSYTSFSYSGLQLEGRTASVSVTNTGNVSGGEVVQLYILPPANSGCRPARELKGFRKVFLAPGESQRVSFELNDRAFAVWQGKWIIPGGVYTVQTGGLTAETLVEGEHTELMAPSWYCDPKGVPTQAEWETYLGRKYIETMPVKGHFTMENTVMEMDHSLMMRLMFFAIKTVIGRGVPKEKRTMENPEYRMVLMSSAGSPLRSMKISGNIKGGVLDGMVEIANGRFLRGVLKMIGR